MNLDAYLARIHYPDSPEADLATLRTLHQLHPAEIVFEAIDVLLDRGVDLSPAAIEAKLVSSGRGGYCFEHNSLFKGVLEAVGFGVEAVAARVLWKRPSDAPRPGYSHMALKVLVDGQLWLADVGFGGRVMTAPLRLGTTEPQPTDHDTFRLVTRRGITQLQTWADDDWRPMYEMSEAAWVDADFEQANWFTSTHPDSKFRRNLIVARTTPEARYTLLDNRFTKRQVNGCTLRLTLNANEIEHELAATFGLAVQPDGAGSSNVLQPRLPAIRASRARSDRPPPRPADVRPRRP